MPGFPVLDYLPNLFKFMSTESMMLSKLQLKTNNKYALPSLFSKFISSIMLIKMNIVQKEIILVF